MKALDTAYIGIRKDFYSVQELASYMTDLMRATYTKQVSFDVYMSFIDLNNIRVRVHPTSGCIYVDYYNKTIVVTYRNP